MVIKISGGRIISGEKIYDNPGIYCEDGFICEKRDNAGEEINAAGLFITPGFIDIHTHGALLKFFHDGTADSFNTISAFQASHGVTALVGATSAMPVAEIVRCCEFMRANAGTEWDGARVLGLHVEGPFLSEKNKGAHRLEAILSCELKNYEPLLTYADAIRIITVAPDNDDAVSMIKAFAGRGVVVSGGHDSSSEPYIEKAIDAGMTHTTHIFCVMSTMTRENGRKYLGLTEFALEDDRLSVELIADGHHVTPRMARLVYKTKASKRVCLVSDMAFVGGLPPGNAIYEKRIPGLSAPSRIVVENGVAKLPDSPLNSGSICAVDQMLRNIVEWGVPLAHAVEMATGAPARVIREYARMGSINAGKFADITLLSPALDVVRTIVGGKTVWVK